MWCVSCFDTLSATLTPSTNTSALYFYAMANACGTWNFQANAGGVYSPIFAIKTACGAPGSNLPQYFGFYTLRGQTLPPITITQLTGPAFGIMVGEFGNFYPKAVRASVGSPPAAPTKANPFHGQPGTATPLK